MPCDDGDPCTAGDQCKAGQCAGGADIYACMVDSDCADEDANPCTGVPYCDTAVSACKTNPVTMVACSTKTDTACRKNTCLATTGAYALIAVKDDTACDDDDPCTANDACVGGGCVGGIDTCKCSADSDCVDELVDEETFSQAVAV